MDKYGEKYSGDSKFVADCRLLQSMYRVKVNEAIRPYKGRDGKTHYYGNLGTNVALEKGTNKPRIKSLETVRQLKCFKPDIEDRITEGQLKLTQIYRNFLLSESYGSKYGLDSYSIILAPADHPSTGKEVDSLRKELREEYKHKIDSISLEDFVGKILKNCPEEYKDAFERFRD